MDSIMFCLCGLPRSGKSHLANKLKLLMDNTSIVSTDQIRVENNIRADDTSKTNDVYRIAYDQLKEVSKSNNSIFDACCNSLSKRKSVQLSTDRNSRRCLIELSVDIDKIYERVYKIGKSNKKILGVNTIAVIDAISKNFEWPTNSEKNSFDFYFKLLWVQNHWIIDEKVYNKKYYHEFEFAESIVSNL